MLKIKLLPDKHKEVAWLFIGGVGVLVAATVANIFVADFRLFVTLFNELIGRLSKNPPSQKIRKEMKALKAYPNRN